MNFKKILAIILALVVGYVIFKVLWWILRHAFALAFDLVGLALIAMIAVPIYFVIRAKLLK